MNPELLVSRLRERSGLVVLPCEVWLPALGAMPQGFQGERAARDYAVHLDEWLLAGRASRFIVDLPAPAPPPVRDFAGPYRFAIGRLVADKGFAVAIRALSAMRHRDVNWDDIARQTVAVYRG